MKEAAYCSNSIAYKEKESECNLFHAPIIEPVPSFDVTVRQRVESKENPSWKALFPSMTEGCVL